MPALSNPIVDVRPEEEQWAFGSVPSLSSPGAPLGLNNPYLHLFSQIDLVFIFQVVLSLLSLLFAYDAIAGDWETGTLRLVLSHPIGRGKVLLAKYIAAMGLLAAPCVDEPTARTDSVFLRNVPCNSVQTIFCELAVLF